MGRSGAAPLRDTGWLLLLVVYGGAAHGLARGVHYFGGEGRDFAVRGDYYFGSANHLSGLFQSGFEGVGIDALDGDHIGAARHGTGDRIILPVVLNRETVGDSLSVGSYALD